MSDFGTESKNACCAGVNTAEGKDTCCAAKNRIADAFRNGKAFIAFITCGDPDLATTAAAVREAVANGADLIELGIPFSDPTAEGPVIQAANVRALAGGVTTDKVFDLVRDLRRDVTVPLVFMTYANVVYSYGAERFLATCEETGIDGLILPDVPFEEKEEFLPYCRRHGVAMISLIAPTSEGRIAMIAKEAEGFLYIVSSLGVTGTRSEIRTNLASIVEAVRQNTDIPCAIGFGISTPEQARAMAAVSDGAIVGSAIVKILAQYGKDAPAHVGAYVKSMKDAMREL
jgi:tryptophan synthase alpha chain